MSLSSTWGWSNAVNYALQPYELECAAHIERLSDNVKVEDSDYLELISGEKTFN